MMEEEEEKEEEKEDGWTDGWTKEKNISIFTQRTRLKILIGG